MKKIVLKTYINGLVQRLDQFKINREFHPEIDHELLQDLKDLKEIVKYAIKQVEKKTRNLPTKKVYLTDKPVYEIGYKGFKVCFECQNKNCNGDCDIPEKYKKQDEEE